MYCLCFFCRNHSPPLNLKPTIIDMTAPSPRKVIPVDTIQAQHIETPPPPLYESKGEEESVEETHKNSTSKSEDGRKRRKKAKRKPRIERLSSQEDQEQLLSSDKELAETLLPLQRSHDQSCDSPVPDCAQSQSAGTAGQSASRTTSTSSELSLNSDCHSAEEGGVVTAQTASPPDTVLLIAH